MSADLVSRIQQLHLVSRGLVDCSEDLVGRLRAVMRNINPSLSRVHAGLAHRNWLLIDGHLNRWDRLVESDAGESLGVLRSEAATLQEMLACGIPRGWLKASAHEIAQAVAAGLFRAVYHGLPDHEHDDAATAERLDDPTAVTPDDIVRAIDRIGLSDLVRVTFDELENMAATLKPITANMILQEWERATLRAKAVAQPATKTTVAPKARVAATQTGIEHPGPSPAIASPPPTTVAQPLLTVYGNADSDGVFGLLVRDKAVPMATGEAAVWRFIRAALPAEHSRVLAAYDVREKLGATGYSLGWVKEKASKASKAIQSAGSTFELRTSGKGAAEKLKWVDTAHGIASQQTEGDAGR